jgi:hypothetical protein
MSAFRIGKSCRTSLLFVLGFAACGVLTLAGCKNANDVTGTTTTAPTIDVAGAWTGASPAAWRPRNLNAG